MYQYSSLGPLILLLIRNGTANDWGSLCAHLGIPPSETSDRYETEDAGRRILWEYLVKLRDAGLIVFSESDRDSFEKGGTIAVSPNLQKIQRSLGISLTQLVEFQNSESMTITPFFGKPRPGINPDIFVLMPFTEELKSVYQDHIRKVAKSLNLKVARADDFFTTHAIMLDIWTAICAVRLIIADCTNRNPNVFYEIGLAHTIGKKVVLITQNKDDVPFDLRHLRYIDYEYTPRGMKEFEKRLTETIKSELAQLPDV